MVTGMTVTAEVLITRNRIWSSLAVSLVRVELLQLAHGLQAQGRGGVVQAQHVGGHVHDDAAAGGVAGGNAGEEAPQQRAEDAGQQVHRAALFADAHDAQPQAHDAGQAQGDLEGGFGHVEGRADHVAPDLGVAASSARTTAATKPPRKKKVQIRLSIRSPGGGRFLDQGVSIARGKVAVMH